MLRAVCDSPTLRPSETNIKFLGLLSGNAKRSPKSFGPKKRDFRPGKV
jgi:hypothetical protein